MGEISARLPSPGDEGREKSDASLKLGIRHRGKSQAGVKAETKIKMPIYSRVYGKWLQRQEYAAVTRLIGLQQIISKVL